MRGSIFPSKMVQALGFIYINGSGIMFSVCNKFIFSLIDYKFKILQKAESEKQKKQMTKEKRKINMYKRGNY